MLHFIATSHAIKHAHNKEDWHCQCLACRFVKEYKFVIEEDDGSLKETTMADEILNALNQEGYCLVTI